MNKILTAALPGTQIDPRHPDSDGRFVGETDYHYVAMTGLHDSIEDFFGDTVDVYVASNLIYYWQEGDPEKRRDPDVLVARGVGKHRRRSYRLWEEKKVPCTFFEIASRRTWRVDLNVKPALYASLGIKEYFMFDPEAKYLNPVLQGFKSVKGQAVPMKPGRDGSLVSKQLGLRLVPEGELLRLIDLATGELVPTRAERAARAEAEKERADALAAEVERLRRLLDQRRP